MSVDQSKYYKRKALGVCVRCEMPTSGSSVLCEAHLNYSRSRRKQKCPDDAPWAIPSQVEPPRPAYKSDKWQNLPPLPNDCPKCGKALFSCELEIWTGYVPAVRCWCCGFTTDRYMLANKLATQI
jgi:hypothetical protein